MRARTEDLSPEDLQLFEDIDENGVHVVNVPASDAGPEYSFSVGLWHSFHQPEVVVFGLPPEVATDLVLAVADEAAEGVQFAADSRHDDLLQDYPVRFLAVPQRCHATHLRRACWAYEGEDFPALQLVWPDKQGRWPWDAGVRDGFRDAQPVLGRQEPQP